MVVTAAGSGQRLGAHIPKALVPLSGYPLFMWAVKEISKLRNFSGGVITAPVKHIADFRQHLATIGVEIAEKWLIVAGGETRQKSIYQGLHQLKERHLPNTSVENDSQNLVLIHDAARALTPVQVFENVIGALEAGWEVATPVLPVVDTIRLVGEEKIEGEYGWELAGEDVPRSQLRIVQTPQGFRFNTIFRLHKEWNSDKNLPEATDDAQMASAAGYQQIFVPGSPDALKITVAADLELAEYLLVKRQK